MEKMICVNLKAYLNSLDEVSKYIESVKDIKDKIIIFPPIIYLDRFIQNGFNVGVQDISVYEYGAHTGSITASSVKDLGVKYVLIGHSEINDSLDNIKLKINNALKNDLRVILCAHDKRIIDDDVIIAYEPVEAINSGMVASNDDITDTLNYYKKQGKKVLYGGSISSENINALNQIDNLDGYLIGKSGVSSIDLKKIEEVISD